MKVLFFCDVSRSLGDGTRSLRNYQYIKNLYKKVTFCNLYHYHYSKIKLVSHFPVITSIFKNARTNDTAYIKNEAYLALATDVLGTTLNKDRPDLIFAEKERCAYAAALNTQNIPVVADLHGILSVEYAESPATKKSVRLFNRIRDIEAEVCVRASDILIVSEKMRAYVLENYGVGENKVTVVQNGSDSFRKKATHSKPLKVVYGGTFDFWEDIDTFLDLAKKDFVNEYFLVGDGPLRRHVLGRIDRERIRVNYLGYKSRGDTLDFFCEMSVGVAPSTNNVTRRIASPVKVYDYMACGLPVVTARYGEWARHVDENDCGFVAEESDADDFLKSINLLQQREVWERKSENGREAIRKKFNWNSVLQPLRDVLGKY